MQNQIQTVNFHNQSLLTLQKDGIAYVAMKPICENIGLNWDAQRQRISRDEVLAQGTVIITAPTKGGLQEMLCLPIHYLNGWLFGVDVSRVKAEIRETLITYKKECYQALFDYWNNGVAVNPRAIKLTDSQQRTLANKVRSVCQNNRKRYPIVWNGLKEKFGVERYSEILSSDFDKAMAQVDIIAKSNFTDDNPIFADQPFFLTQNTAREFDARLKHIFDLAELVNDCKPAQLMHARIKELHNFLCAYQKQHYPNNLPALP